MFFSKLEPKIPFLRLQSQASLLSHLMNSTDYFIKSLTNSRGSRVAGRGSKVAVAGLMLRQGKMIWGSR